MLTLKELEYKAIKQHFKAAKGRIAVAAKTLGIGRATMYRKLEQHKLLKVVDAKGRPELLSSKELFSVSR